MSLNEIPDELQIKGIHPNPFNPHTTIKYEISKSTYLSLKVYDISGREVTTLTKGNILAGAHEISWDASNYSSGIYFIKLSSNNFSQTKKIMLIK